MEKEAKRCLEAGTIQHRNVPDAWQTKTQELVGLPFPWPWLFIAAILFGVALALAYQEPINEKLIRLYGILCILIAGLANAVVFFEMLVDEAADTWPSLLEEKKEVANAWISLWYDRMFWSSKNIWCALAMMLLLARSNYATVESFHLEHLSTIIYTYLLLFIMSFMSGSTLWVMLCIARMFWSLGRAVRIRPSIFDTRTSVLRAASSVMFKVSLVGAGLYLLGLSIIYFCKTQLDGHQLFLLVFFGIFILGYFIVPQRNIHKALVEIKRSHLSKLVVQIERYFTAVTEDPTKENIDKLHDLFGVQAVLNSKTVFPSGLAELLSLIGSIFIPLLALLYEVMSKQGGVFK
ncbi:MAG: hypothetical protein KQH53_16855 [Desulfarculaceae bacterium]|nr:hypothetical protein [Desulfarculaceae bacterium]